MIVMDNYLTVEEIATELKVTPDTIQKLLRQKRLIGFKVGGVWRVTKEDLERYVEEQKKRQQTK